MFLGALAALQVGSLWNLHFNDRYEREDVRSAAAYVGSRARVRPSSSSGGIDDPWRHYYSSSVPSRVLHVSEGAAVRSREVIHEALEKAPAVWVVSGRLWEEPGSEELIAAVSAWGTEGAQAVFAGGVEVRRYDARGQ